MDHDCNVEIVESLGQILRIVLVFYSYSVLLSKLKIESNRFSKPCLYLSNTLPKGFNDLLVEGEEFN